ncbi:hypothetical protein TSUD_142080 [Trifolium subterraneum]|uniref:Uncharacterized protein n=1 Tax=Trifolium subterraneum TaxID=3900 RepID=A0A2Z6LK41_TRISU|nr:hypothetical protein TSUD_142080 [Trifolium subterraneum]
MNAIHYGSENEGNLVVVEQKRKRGVEKPFAVTVAHYYAASKQTSTWSFRTPFFGIASYVSPYQQQGHGNGQNAFILLLQLRGGRQRSGVNGKRLETETENDDEE